MWFTETPWPPVMCCGLALLIMLFLWIPDQRNSYLYIMFGIIALALVIVVVERMIITESETVEQAVRDVAAAFEQRDPDLAFSFFSPTVQKLWKKPVYRSIERIRFEKKLEITDIQVEMKAENSRAVSEFRANSTVTLDGTSGLKRPSKWEVTWQKEGGEWKIIKVVPLNPVTNEILYWFQ